MRERKMYTDPSPDVIRVNGPAERELALRVMRVIYRDEKNWIRSDEKLVSAEDLVAPQVSWFVARHSGEPVGVVRVLYEPPLDLYRQYGFKLLSTGFDLDAFIRRSRIAEIGRFAVIPGCRRQPAIALTLMKAACSETVARGFTHYITDVFEGEAHSPYGFHTRVMGFKAVATHDVGELNCPNRRITMILDLREAYHRLKAKSPRVFSHLTAGWTPAMHADMAHPAAVDVGARAPA